MGSFGAGPKGSDMSMPDMMVVVASPCVDRCTLNAAQICIGCGRTSEEIALWRHADDKWRLAIREAAEQRLRGMRSEARGRREP